MFELNIQVNAITAGEVHYILDECGYAKFSGATWEDECTLTLKDCDSDAMSSVAAALVRSGIPFNFR